MTDSELEEILIQAEKEWFKDFTRRVAIMNKLLSLSQEIEEIPTPILDDE